MSTWLNGIIGQGIASGLGGCGHTAQQNAAQATQYGLSQNQAQAQQAAMAAQQAYGVGMSQGTYNGQPFTAPKWMFNGKMMNFQEFVNTVFPDDCAEKTAFVLKYSE